jgi:hypothetical protein
MAAKLGGLFAGINAAAFGLGLKKAFDAGGALSDLSAATGAAAADLAVLQQAFADAGVGADAVGPSVAKLQRNIAEAAGGNKTAAEAFARLGLSAGQLSGTGAAGQMKAVGAAIAAIENPSARASAAMDVFGKKGAALLAVFSNSGAFDSAAAAVGGQAQLLEKNAGLFDDISDKLAQTGLKVQGFFVGVADRVAPVLKPLLDGFASLDLAGLGQQVGDVIAFLIQAFSDGQIGAILGASIEIAIKEAANGVVSFLGGIGGALGQLLADATLNAVELFGALREPQFWSGLGDTLIGLSQGFVAAMLDGVAKVIDALSGIPVIGEKIGGAAEGVRRRAADIRAVGGEYRAGGAEALAPFVARAKERLAQTLGNIGGAFREGAAAAPELFDPGEAQSRLDGAMDRVFAAIEQNRVAAEEFVAAPKPALAPIEEEGGGGKRPALGPAFAQTLARVGGGGAAVGGGGPDPMLEESRRQSSLLAQIARNTAPKGQPKPEGLTPRFA